VFLCIIIDKSYYNPGKGRQLIVTAQKDITRLLVEWSNGDQAALSKLMPMVYKELHFLAGRHLKRGSPDQVMQTTVLVHEAFLRLVDQQHVNFNNRAHFFAVASKAMRQILVNYALAQRAAKRGGGFRVTLSDAVALTNEKNLDVAALDEALKILSNIDQRKSEIIELRFFSGLSLEETAEVLNISIATVKREWKLARAWLLRELKGERTHDT
jgi:RNA polymerase sigma factor (TIGR02999 family)